MRLVDDRGRLFGRLNVIDAAIAAVLLLLIPLGYVAYRLFRTPVPQVLTLQPTLIPPGREAVIRLEGRDFRPYLRAYAGTKLGVFLEESATKASVTFPPLTSGVYDLILYDEAREVSRTPNALTVEALHRRVLLSGAFTGLTGDRAQALRAGITTRKVAPPSWARLTEVFPPEPDVVVPRPDLAGQQVTNRFRVPAVVELDCVVSAQGCMLGDVVLARDTDLSMPLSTGTENFRVRSLLPSDLYPVEIVIRLDGPPEATGFAKVGDLDTRFADFGPGFQAVLLSVGHGSARVRVPVRKVASNLEYGSIVKVGNTFKFETMMYVLEGTIIDLRLSARS